MCNSTVSLQFLAQLQFYCLFHSAFRDLATEQGELGIRAQEEGEERTFQKIVSMELRKACCVAALKEMACLPIITQMGTQSCRNTMVVIAKILSSPKPAQLEDK